MPTRIVLFVLTALLSITFACEPPPAYVEIWPENNSRVPINTTMEIAVWYGNLYNASKLEETAVESNGFENFEFYLASENAETIPLTVRDVSGKLSLTHETELAESQTYQLTAAKSNTILILSTFTTIPRDTIPPAWFGTFEIDAYSGYGCSRAGDQPVKIRFSGILDNVNHKSDLRYALYFSDIQGVIDSRGDPDGYMDHHVIVGELYHFGGRIKLDAITKLGIRPVDRSGNFGPYSELEIDSTQIPYIIRQP